MSSRRNRVANRSLLRLTLVSAALYALFLLVTPFEHHDLSCELKTPEHCAACVASVVSIDPHVPTIPGAGLLADAGSAVSLDLFAESLLLGARTTGRSPPPLT
jgi:hypothetical protein